MIQITATIDGKTDLTRFIPNLMKNIKASETNIARRITNKGFSLVRARAPFFRGDLKNSIAKKFFPKTKKGEIFISGGFLAQMKARANEFGVDPHYVNRDEFPLIDEWASEKGYINNRFPNLVMVGGRGTRLGRQNKFFTPGFNQLVKLVPQVVAGEIGKALQRTRA